MKKVTDIKQLKLIANSIRQDIIKMLERAGSGHPAGSLGMADVFTALYFNVANHNPKNPNWVDRDRIILSNGHICPVRYACMAHTGYFPKMELMTLRKIDSRLQGHPHNLSLPGVETSSGPLGQGVSQAMGFALAAKLDKKDYRIWLLMSDGEMQEGQTWEALMFAAKYRLDNVTAIIDRNYIQISGNTEDVMPLEPLKNKLMSFKWYVIEAEGHDFPSILNALEESKTIKEMPTAVICHTIPGKGVSFMENKSEWHGKAPDFKQAKEALQELEEEKKRILKEGW